MDELKPAECNVQKYLKFKFLLKYEFTLMNKNCYPCLLSWFLSISIWTASEL